MSDLELIRSQNPIEDVVGEKFKLKKSGSYYKGVEHDSLVVNPGAGFYHWNSQDEHGDVFDFVGRHFLSGSWNSHDKQKFIEAVCYLARRAGITLPEKSDAQNSELWAERTLIRRLQDALFAHEEALTYVTQKRGWERDILLKERIGYMPANKHQLLEGLSGLADRWRQTIHKFPSNMIVYIHMAQGRLAYVSGRSITAKRHYNAEREIVGERQPYFNHLYRPDTDTAVLVEGQADAISFGVWGIAAVALGGMNADEALNESLQGHRRIFVLLDNTPEAQAKGLRIARQIGIKACLPALPEKIKDANDLLLSIQPSSDQVMTLLNSALTLMEKEINLIQQMPSLEQEDALHALIKQAAAWDKFQTSKLRQLMKDQLKVPHTLFDSLLKAAQESKVLPISTISEDAPQILEDDIPIISPALGFLPGVAVLTVSLMETNRHNQINLAPYMVTSERELIRLDKSQLIQIGKQKVALRVVPEGTEFLQRWRYRDIQRYLQGEAVSPQEVFQVIHNLFNRHVDFSTPHDSQIVTLWIIGTYFYTMFAAYPYLALNGPKNSGKSTVLNVTKPLAFNMITTSDVTGPSLFRLIHQNSCTVGIDEAERYHNAREPEMQAMRQILNSGYKPGMPAIRLMGDDMRPQAFNLYSPKMLASIAGFEDVLASRCIPVPMRRADRKMPVFSPGYDGAVIRHALYTLALTHSATIYHNYVHRPELHTLLNRSNELWSPLIALAAFFEEVGGITGLLDTVRQAANRDYSLNQGKALSNQEEIVLQVLELLTRERENPAWIKASLLRKQVLEQMEVTAETIKGVQWIGHILNRLHLTDRDRKKHHTGGESYLIDRQQVLEMMRRYEVQLIENEN